MGHHSRTHHSRHRSRERDSRRRSRSRDHSDHKHSNSDSRHRNHKKSKHASEERELRKKQERLAKARLLLLEEEDTEDIPVMTETTHNDSQDTKHQLHDDLELDYDMPVHTQAEVGSEIDPLDVYMMEIDKEAAPQEGKSKQHAAPEISESDLSEEEYHQQFIDAFAPKLPSMPDLSTKPEVLFEEEPETAWDMLLENDESEDFLKKVMTIQQRKIQDKRKLPTIDHSQIEYEPFRKDLYIPCQELAKLEYEEILQLREDIGDIKVRGKRCPAPILNWFQCGLSDKILGILDKKKFKGPFPIQAQVSVI